MFSGIIENTGIVASISDMNGEDKITGRRIVVLTEQNHKDTQIGDSVSIDGVCLTVVDRKTDKENKWLLSFDLASETLRCTTFGELKEGDCVHLEQSICVGDKIHGHIVTGHVDCVGSVILIKEEGETTRIDIKLSEISPMIVKKGSVAVAGVSLTVGEVKGDTFSVYIIPHTKSVTKLGKINIGEKLNIEFDIFARYAWQQNIIYRDAFNNNVRVVEKEAN